MMKKVILLTLLSLTILGCSSDDNETVVIETDYSLYISENAIATDIFFMPEEIYLTNETQAPSLKLKLITAEIYPCSNYKIGTTQFVTNNELIVRFDEIIEDDPCLTLFDAATSFIDLPTNINKITFLNGDAIDKYTIEFTTQKIILSSADVSFTTSLYTETYRIPENSFAFICATNTNNTYVYEDFSAILAQNPNFTEFEFEIEEDLRIPYPMFAPGGVSHDSKFYTYTNPQEFNNLANVLNNYAAENIIPNTGVSITLRSWNNIKFYSWIEN